MRVHNEGAPAPGGQAQGKTGAEAHRKRSRRARESGVFFGWEPERKRHACEATEAERARAGRVRASMAGRLPVALASSATADPCKEQPEMAVVARPWQDP